MKALSHALILWPLALTGLSACASSASSGDGETGASSASIIGGHLDTTTKGVVALALSAHNQVGVICSGSLIAPNLVLTARHCVSQIGDGSSEAVDCSKSKFTAKYDPREIFVSTDSQPQSGSKLYALKEIREAPGSSNVCGYDIAMLILSGSGVPSSEAKPIEPVLDHAPAAKQSFAAVGYGLQDPNDTQGQTAGTRMRFDQSSVYCVGPKCPQAAAVEDDEFVGDSPVCSGDSGGPALDADGRVFGVTSRGDDQCTYALYSSVAEWAVFVRSTAIAAATSGGYTPPSWATGASGAGGAGNGGGSSSTGGSSNAGSSSGGSPNGGSAAGGRTSGGNGTGGNATGGHTTGGSTASGNASGTAGAGTTTPPTGPAQPTVDPLGTACTSECPGTYQCYAATGAPPGICVPQCSAASSTCPDGYSCSPTLKACTPTTSKTAHVSGSCAVSPGSNSGYGTSGFATLLGLVLLRFGRRRRCAA